MTADTARKSRPEVSVVIGSYNRCALLRRTIGAVRRELQDTAHEIIVVDGGSQDGSLRWLTRQKDILTIAQHNRGTWRRKEIERKSWGYFMNLGFKSAQGRWVCMLSDDTLPVPGAIVGGIAQADRQRDEGRNVGAAAFYWRNVYKQDPAYLVGLTLGGNIIVNHGLYLRQALEDVGFADEDRYFFYHGDSDLSLRITSAGYEVVDCPASFVEHFPHAGGRVRQSNLARQQADWDAFLDRWLEVFPSSRGREFQGSARFRDFVDPHRTYRDFPPVTMAVFFVRRYARRIARKLGLGTLCGLGG